MSRTGACPHGWQRQADRMGALTARPGRPGGNHAEDFLHRAAERRPVGRKPNDDASLSAPRILRVSQALAGHGRNAAPLAFRRVAHRAGVQVQPAALRQRARALAGNLIGQRGGRMPANATRTASPRVTPDWPSTAGGSGGAVAVPSGSREAGRQVQFRRLRGPNSTPGPRRQPARRSHAERSLAGAHTRSESQIARRVEARTERLSARYPGAPAAPSARAVSRCSSSSARKARIFSPSSGSSPPSARSWRA